MMYMDDDCTGCRKPTECETDLDMDLAGPGDVGVDIGAFITDSGAGHPAILL